jgi:predicted dehydrogenase
MDFEGGEIFWVSRGDDNVLNDRVVMRPRRGRPKAVLLPAMTRIDRAGTLTEFASAISDGREPETSGRDNLSTLAMTTAAVESADRGEAMQVPRLGAQLAY